jgi:Spy/CpxP family protein refolding chaperone
MKQNILVFLLAVSLLFNVFVLIGFTQGRAAQGERSPSDESLDRQVTKELNLDDNQSKVFVELRRDFRRQNGVINESFALVQQDLMAEMRKDSPDLDRVRELISTRSELDHERRLANAELYARFVQVLRPEQRRAMWRRFGGGPGPNARGGPGPVILRRFDANHDGTLDEAEMRNAQERLDALRQEVFRPKPPPNAWRQFDRDRDGQLSDDEKAAMDAARRQRRPMQGGPDATMPQPPL